MTTRLSPALEDAHRALSPANLSLLNLLTSTPECLTRSAFGALGAIDSRRPYPLQVWPTLVSPEMGSEMKYAALGLYALVKSMPERFFDRDPRRICQEYGIPDSPMLSLVFGEPNGISSGLMRGDFLYTESGWKCLEVNIGGNLGGMEASSWADSYMTNPLIHELVSSLGVSLHSLRPARALFEHLVDDVIGKAASLERSVNLGLLVSDETPPVRIEFASELGNAELAAVLAERGIDLQGRVVVASPKKLGESSENLTLDGIPVHAILKLHDIRIRALFRYFKAGRIQLYNTPAAELLSNKITLALLSERQDSDLLSREEREVLVRHLPWTRRVRGGATIYQGERVDLPALLLARRSEMVLKPSDGLGGAGIVLGWSTPQEEWANRVEHALKEGKWIVQERVESRPFLYQAGESGYCEHDLVWGLFGFGSRFGGAFLRMAPKDMGGIVNSARGATESTFLLAE